MSEQAFKVVESSEELLERIEVLPVVVTQLNELSEVYEGLLADEVSPVVAIDIAESLPVIRGVAGRVKSRMVALGEGASRKTVDPIEIMVTAREKSIVELSGRLSVRSAT